MMQGIDISHWNGNIDFYKVKKDGKEFAIIKAGGSETSNPYKDSMFETYYKQAKQAGIYVGAYYYVGKKFITESQGKLDAIRFSELLKGKTFEMPVCLDLEETSPSSKEGATRATIAFCEYMESLGYYVSIYASTDSGFKERLNTEKLTAYDKWVASWSNKKPTYPKSYGMWQYSSKGRVNGINGNVDLDIAYKDYPSVITPTSTNETLKDEMWKQYVEIAKDVIRGDYGDGNTRITALSKSGYDYRWVQKIVNKLLG